MFLCQRPWDLFSRTQEYECAPCFGKSDLMSAQALAGSGSAWYKHTAKAMDELTQGLSKSGRNLTTKKQRKEIGDIGIAAVKQRVDPAGAAIDQFDDLYLTGKGNCASVKQKALRGKGVGKAIKKEAKKAGKAVSKTAKKAKPSKKLQKEMLKDAAAGAVAGGITGAAAGGPMGAVGGASAGAVGGASGAYVKGKTDVF